MGFLAALRAAALAILLLLIWNPRLPVVGAPAEAEGPWVLLDASLSMLAGEGGRSAWEEARAAVEEFGDMEGRLFLGGEQPQPVSASLNESPLPSARSSRMAPALERLAELGAREITLVSDLRIEDPVALRAAAGALPLRLTLRRVGGGTRNAAISRVEHPATIRSGDTLRMRVSVMAEGVGPVDSASIEVREEGRPIAVRRTPLPGEGRSFAAEFDLPPPRSSGEVRYTIGLRLEGDLFPHDDRRIAYVTVDPPESGILLLSLRPDWEPRFLIPVLKEATGLAAHGYLHAGGGRYIPIRLGAEEPEPIDEPGLRRRISEARLLVLHGVSGDLPGWLRGAASQATRLLAFPRDREGATLLGLEAGDARGGEWYVSPDPPASPLAADLSGARLSGLPPLTGVLPLVPAPSSGVPLTLQLLGMGSREAAMVLMSRDGPSRSVVALASGFWRWGVRDGAPRDVYRRLWAGVVGWLLGGEEEVVEDGLRPAHLLLPAGEPMVWRAPGDGGQGGEPPGFAPPKGRRRPNWTRRPEKRPGRTRRPEKRPERVGRPRKRPNWTRRPRSRPDRTRRPESRPERVGRPAAAGAPGEAPGMDTVITVPESERFQLAALPPGRYRFEASPSGEPAEGSEGSFDVDPFSAEMLTPPLELEEEAMGGESESPSARAAPRRPMRTSPLPYLAFLAILALEWVLRRRRGLR